MDVCSLGMMSNIMYLNKKKKKRRRNKGTKHRRNGNPEMQTGNDT